MILNYRASAKPVSKRLGILLAGALICLSMTIPSLPVLAATAPDVASPWHDNPSSSVRLIAAQDGTGAAKNGGPLLFGLDFRMAEHWKIYWRSPGDAGYPPRIDWSGSENVKSVKLKWPAPSRFSILGLQTLGYENAVVFPLDVTPKDASRALRLDASISYLACSDICVPEEAHVSLNLPAGGGGITRNAHEINRFASLVPGDGTAQGLVIELPRFASGKTPSLLVTARSVSGMVFHAPDLYVEGPPHLSFGKPLVNLANAGLEARFQIPIYAPRTEDIALIGKDITLTLVDGQRNAEATESVAEAKPGTVLDNSTPVKPVQLGLAILGIAFLGGLILNLMPCVLPVLAIKLASFVGKAGAARAHVRRGFLASAAGIVVAFMLLGGVLIALKLGGMAIGWGIQFQQPVFLSLMAAIVTLFACNLWGLFEIRLPAFIARLGAAGGQPRADHETPISGHFLTGMLATVLATPCSAPFLGTAIGFALARGPLEITAIFTTAGVGLAAPYLLVAAVPGMAGLLPKPGPWMIVLKRILALALIGTAAWLLSVLSASTGASVAAAAGAALIVACLGLWLVHRAGKGLHTASRGLIAAALLAAVLVPSLESSFARTPSAVRSTDTEDGVVWRPLNRTEIDKLVGDGKTVLVDVTADWCLTCKVNKAVALGDPAVRSMLHDEGIVAMKGDWTLPDPMITQYLASYRRYGIPFNAVYGPAAPDGIVLPELLRAGDVLKALRKARGMGAEAKSNS